MPKPILKLIPNPFKDLKTCMLFTQKNEKPGKGLWSFHAAARNRTHQKESRSALPKAKENLINRIWYEFT
jgi:hypothetical protein